LKGNFFKPDVRRGSPAHSPTGQKNKIFRNRKNPLAEGCRTRYTKEYRHFGGGDHTGTEIYQRFFQKRETDCRAAEQSQTASPKTLEARLLDAVRHCGGHFRPHCGGLFDHEIFH
jgi:hypothetical protein